MVEHHSAVGVAAWTDLLRSLKDNAVSDIRGKPTLKTIGDRAYWYDRYRLGTEVVDRYIGEDPPDPRARLDRHEEIAADQRSSMTEALDVARTAARAGARSVTVMSLESAEEMPAHDFEVEEAQHEGISFAPRRGPRRERPDRPAHGGAELQAGHQSRGA